MEKLYGYKQQDVLSLIEYLNSRKGESLTDIFAKFALEKNKARGSVRNMYYAIAKASINDEEFRNKYLDGKVLRVNEILEFDKEEEKKLLKEILLKRQEGYSVRKAISMMTDNDPKKSLRIQNKYRNIIKKDQNLVGQVMAEIKASESDFNINKNESPKNWITDIQYLRLKNQIDKLVGSISLKIRKENEYLKEQVASLKLENLRLNNLLFSDRTSIMKYFQLKNGKDVIN